MRLARETQPLSTLHVPSTTDLAREVQHERDATALVRARGGGVDGRDAAAVGERAVRVRADKVSGAKPRRAADRRAVEEEKRRRLSFRGVPPRGPRHDCPLRNEGAVAIAATVGDGLLLPRGGREQQQIAHPLAEQRRVEERERGREEWMSVDPRLRGHRGGQHCVGQDSRSVGRRRHRRLPNRFESELVAPLVRFEALPAVRRRELWRCGLRHESSESFIWRRR